MYVEFSLSHGCQPAFPSLAQAHSTDRTTSGTTTIFVYLSRPTSDMSHTFKILFSTGGDFVFI